MKTSYSRLFEKSSKPLEVYYGGDIPKGSFVIDPLDIRHQMKRIELFLNVNKPDKVYLRPGTETGWRVRLDRPVKFISQLQTPEAKQASGRIVSASIANKPERKLTVTISGTEEQVNRIEALLCMIHLNGGWGHSGIFGIAWDGDGTDRATIDGLDVSSHKDMVEACGKYGSMVEYVGEGGTGRVILDRGQTAETKTVFPPEEK